MNQGRKSIVRNISHEKEIFGVESIFRIACVATQSDLRTILAADNSIRPYFTVERTLQISDKTAWMYRLVTSHTVRICQKAPFRRTMYV